MMLTELVRVRRFVVWARPGRSIDACLQKGRIVAALAVAEAAGYSKRKDLPRPPQRRLKGAR